MTNTMDKRSNRMLILLSEYLQTRKKGIKLFTVP